MLAAVTCLVFLATGTIWIGSHLSASNDQLISVGETVEREVVDLTWSQAVAIPITSSIFLMLLFYFFEYLQYVLVGMLVLSATLALYQLFYYYLRRLTHQQHPIHFLCILLTAFVVWEWITTGHFVFHDILGCSLCVFFIATLRFPSLRIAALCLFLLLAYDVFWVFFSELIFQKNVMVEVATKAAANPVQQVGEQLHIEALKSIQTTLELPIKLILPDFASSRKIMLGLGDIALPGALISLAMRCDRMIRDFPHSSNDIKVDEEAAGSLIPQENAKKSAICEPYLFLSGLLGYFIGLIVAFCANWISGHAQPALIYLVPSVMAPIAFRAWLIDRLNDVWLGPRKVIERN